jgi:hypothetical protein
MRVAICDILYQGTHCHFQHLASALNQSCLQRERRFSFPVSFIANCYCLSCDTRRAGLTVSDTDTQSPPDPRMNRPSKHPDRLSLDRPLLSNSLVTRPTLIVSKSVSCFNSNRLSKTFAAIFVRDKGSLSPPVRTRLSFLSRVPCRPRQGRAQERRTPDTHFSCRPSTYRRPASWPALSRQAIRYVPTCASRGFRVFSSTWPTVIALLPILQTPLLFAC